MSKIIHFKLDKLLKKYRLSQRQVALECNIRPTTLKMYVDNAIQRINLKDLESLYNFFYELDDRTTINDLIEIKDKSFIDSLNRMDLFNEYNKKD
jgi:hypothetical protein